MSGLIYHTDKRRVIPQLEKTATYVETHNATGPVTITKKRGVMLPIINLKDDDLTKKIEEWKKSKSYDLAGDIISQAMILQKNDEVEFIKKHLIENYPKDEMFNWLFSTKRKEIPNEEKINHNIKKLKIEPNDSVTLTEQAINFLEINNREEAVQCIESALKINHNSGYIVRNASRIFNIIGDNSRAIKILKKSEYYKHDPQILSAEISFSQIEGRKTIGEEIGHKLLKDSNYRNNEKSELASSLGTIEHFKGEYKKAEKLFDLSLIEPNINSLTQSLWYKKNQETISKHSFLNESSEIKTLNYSNDMNYTKSLEYALKWKEEEPYSVRPYRLASHLSGELLRNFDHAFMLMKEASESQKEIKGDNYTKKDKVISNNDMAYYLLKSGRTEEAAEFLSNDSEINKKNQLEDYEYVYLATMGLYAYKKGKNEMGKSHYKRTIKYFNDIKDFYHASSAFINYFEEELNFIKDLDSLNQLKKELDDYVNNNSVKDLQFRKKHLLKMLDEKVEALK
jgi:hypothetical protein